MSDFFIDQLLDSRRWQATEPLRREFRTQVRFSVDLTIDDKDVYRLHEGSELLEELKDFKPSGIFTALRDSSVCLQKENLALAKALLLAARMLSQTAHPEMDSDELELRAKSLSQNLLQRVR